MNTKERRGRAVQWMPGDSVARTHRQPAEADVESCCCRLILYSQNGGIEYLC